MSDLCQVDGPKRIWEIGLTSLASAGVRPLPVGRRFQASTTQLLQL
jgi:hypothetical protein